MIEGLRVLPFWQALISEAPTDARRDCTTCMATYSIKFRETLGCGHLPRSTGRLGLWSPTHLVDEWNATPPDQRAVDPVMHCPGYTTSLAEVREVAMAYPQYKAGYLAEFVGGVPTPELLYGCAILDRAHNAWEAAEMKKRSEEAKRG